MALVTDLVIVLIILLIIWRSAVHGFMRTIVEMTGYVLAAFISLTFTGVIAETIYDFALKPNVTEKVNSAVSDMTMGLNQKVDYIWDGLPSFVTGAVNLFGSSDSIRDSITSNIEASTPDVSDKISKDIVRPIFVNTLKSLLSVVLFTAMLFLIRFFARSINRICSFSVLGGLNTFLGGLIGLIKGIVVICLAVFLIKLGIQCMHGKFLFFDEAFIEQTKLLKIIYNIPLFG